ncbi:MAG: CPBP family intramembrane metalloprotease [Deltaproteobacteria bacterium]|nr:CPBP family intramembrane metalloprotease [Deltaproteobacteria bacterium]
MGTRRTTQFPATKRMAEGRRSRDFWLYFRTRPTLRAELLYLFPLAVLYHVGANITGVRNGVDVVSLGLSLLDRYWPRVVLGLEFSVLAAFVVLYFWARKQEHFGWKMMGRVLVESAVYAVTIGSAIVLVLTGVFRMHPPTMGPTGSGGWLWIVQVSAGAGLYEELVFRLFLFGGLVHFLQDRDGWSKGAAVAAAMPVSAVLFALAHHIPPSGEPLALWPLAYRTLAGMLFAVVYYYRGLSVAAYTHAIYDVYVMALGA